MRSAAGWTGRRACRLWNQSGSWSAGKVIGENSRTKNTSTWEASWASIAGSVTAIAYATAVAMVVTRTEGRSEEHTSELQSRGHLVCRLLLEKNKTNQILHPLRTA